MGLFIFICLIDSDRNVFQELLFPMFYYNDDWIVYLRYIAYVLTLVNLCVDFIIYFLNSGNVKRKLVDFCWNKGRETETHVIVD